MKQAKIKATRDYYDTQLDRLIKNGEETIVPLDRAETITSINFAILIETIEDKPQVEETKPAPKKRATRKKKK
jgi:hypothetical protein